MNIEKTTQTAVSLLTPWMIEVTEPAENRVDVVLAVADLDTAVQALVRAEWGYLAAITGLDLGVDEPELEVLYHFCEGAVVLTLRVRVLKETAVIPTICTIIPSASFFERELSEMFGITITDSPNPDRLFLPDKWPEEVYPLRKDFEPQGVGVKD